MSDQALTPQQQMLQQLRIGCHGYVDGFNTSYGYMPSLAAGIVFLVLFGLSMIAHTVQCVWKRTWWTMVFTVGCMSTFTLLLCLSRVMLMSTAEVIGWAGRTWSNQCPYNSDAFLMQISTLIIG